MNDAPDGGDAEILGRLPRTRPGRRSPRRDEAAERRARAAARAAEQTASSSASAARAADPGLEAEAARAEGSPPGPADALAGIARTGVSVASGTVGLGLRAAGGALRAIRDTVDRR